MANEFTIDARARCFQDRFLNSFEKRNVTIDAHRHVVRGKCSALTKHAADFLRVAESLQASFGKRVDAHDLATAARGFLQRDQHARMVGAWILPDHHNAVRGLKVLERHGALARSDRSHHANAA